MWCSDKDRGGDPHAERSKDRGKARRRLARLHTRVSRTARKDFLHKLSAQLVREKQAVFMEGPVHQ
ncbi:transposase [Paraburkholderia sediminicola]|uniref:transposase n=1 Tax=Paraburkholderia sediminicola TaxID=458836 RepID=UPI0038BC32D0